MRMDVFVLRPCLRLRELNRRLWAGDSRWTDEDDAETGRLLGYSERDIASFLSHKRRLTPGR